MEIIDTRIIIILSDMKDDRESFSGYKNNVNFIGSYLT